MTRKLFLFFVILMITLFVVSPVLAAKSYRAERFDVLIALQENGSAIVTETVEFHFEGDPFTFAFREIDANKTDGITFLDASMDGTVMPQGKESGQVEVEAGDPLEVKWHFPGTANAAHVFVVRYRVDGLVRKGEADTIIWRAIPEDHDYVIQRSTITLTYPSGAKLLGEPTLSRAFTSVLTDGPLKLTANDLGKDDDLILTARFAPDSLTQVMPKWQARDQQIGAALPFGLIAGLVTLLLGGLGLFSFARANAREAFPGLIVPNPSPPSDLPAVVVGKLLGKAGSLMGTVFELAQRGVLEVREEKGILGTKNHLLIRKETNIPLRPDEKGLLDAIFKTGETEMKMSEIGTRVAGKSTQLDELLEQEMLQRGWRDSQRKTQRTRLIATGIIGMFASAALVVASLISIKVLSGNLNLIPLMIVVLGICVGALLFSLGLLIYGATFSTLTPSGEEQVVRWKGFEEYLKQVSKGKESAIRPDYFERYLAYAAMFGLGANWAKYFQTLGGVPLPIWFHATAGSNADFAVMVAVMSTSDSTGASAGGDGGGGGAGASGGGGSGAG